MANAVGKRWLLGVVLDPGTEVIPLAGNCSGFVVTKDGEAWLLSNQDRLVLKQESNTVPF